MAAASEAINGSTLSLHSVIIRCDYPYKHIRKVQSNAEVREEMVDNVKDQPSILVVFLHFEVPTLHNNARTCNWTTSHERFRTTK